MDQTKIEIISGVLAKQITRNRDAANLSRREMSEHTGAAQILALLMKQLPSFMTQLEQQIEGDSELGRSAENVRSYAKRIVGRFNEMCETQCAHQRTNALLCDGRAQAAEQAIVMLEKEIATEQATTARRNELNEERRAAEAREAAEAIAPVIEPVSGKLKRTKQPGRKKPQT